MSTEQHNNHAAGDVSVATDLLTPTEAAAILDVARCTLAAWRQRGRGPAFTRLGYRTVRYSRMDLIDWIAAQSVTPRRGAAVVDS